MATGKTGLLDQPSQVAAETPKLAAIEGGPVIDNTNVVPLHEGIDLSRFSSPACEDLLPAVSDYRTVQSPPPLPAGTAPLGGFANFTSSELARMCGCPLSLVKRWHRTGRAPAGVVALLELLHYGPLRMLSPAWAAWSLRNGKLGNSDGHEFTPGEVWAIPILHQRIAGLEATIRRLRADLELAECRAGARSREYRMAKARGQMQALSRIVFALISDLKTSDDGERPALEGMDNIADDALRSVLTMEMKLLQHAEPTPEPSASPSTVRFTLEPDESRQDD